MKYPLPAPYVWRRMSRSELSSHSVEADESAEDLGVSAVSASEIATKQGLGTLIGEEAILDDPADHDLRVLPVTWEHARELCRIPVLHRDPFDRLLVAQARVEGRILVTADERPWAHDVATMPA